MKILVALEESQFSDKALAWAVEYAKINSAELTAISVVEGINQFEELSPGMVDAINEKFTDQARETISRAKSFAMEHGLEIKRIVTSGTTAQDGILDHAKSDGVDLVVVGSRGRKGVNRFVMGSVASRVLRHAHCSVAVVR